MGDMPPLPVSGRTAGIAVRHLHAVCVAFSTLTAGVVQVAEGQIRATARPPKGLNGEGRRLWRSVVSAYDLRADELVVLESACRCADLVVQLDEAMRGQPLVSKGSMGQEREHPLLSEQRQQRALMVRTLASLKLPDLDSSEQPADDAAGARSVAARRAAQARWGTGQSRWARSQSGGGA